MKLHNSFLFITILFLQSFAWSQNSATDQLLKMDEEQRRQAESSAEDLRRLEEERSRLGQKLSEMNEQITYLQGQNSPANVVTSITVEEIAHYMENKKVGECVVTPGESLGEYFIERDKIKIRFVFLSKGDVLEPKVSFKKNDRGDTLLEVLQPGYAPNEITKEGAISATVRFLFTNNEVKDVVHAVFNGQRVEDKWFGYKSSYERKNITCAL